MKKRNLITELLSKLSDLYNAEQERMRIEKNLIVDL